MDEEIDAPDTNGVLFEFRDPQTRKFRQLTAAEFLRCWRHFDTDKSGYLECEELEKFLSDLIDSVRPRGVGVECISQAAASALREELITAYDDDEDGRLSMLELANLLPTETKFVHILRECAGLKSGVELIRLWRKFDHDNSGYLEGDEVRYFLAGLFERTHVELTENELNQFCDTILNLFDLDGDGRLQLTELSRLMPNKTSFLQRPILETGRPITNYEFNRIFAVYDTNGNGFLEGDEVDGFIKDLLDICGKEFNLADLENVKQSIMDQWDADGDGKLGREELRTIILHSRKADAN